MKRLIVVLIAVFLVTGCGKFRKNKNTPPSQTAASIRTQIETATDERSYQSTFELLDRVVLNIPIQDMKDLKKYTEILNNKKEPAKKRQMAQPRIRQIYKKALEKTGLNPREVQTRKTDQSYIVIIKQALIAVYRKQDKQKLFVYKRTWTPEPGHFSHNLSTFEVDKKFTLINRDGSPNQKVKRIIFSEELK